METIEGMRQIVKDLAEASNAFLKSSKEYESAENYYKNSVKELEAKRLALTQELVLVEEKVKERQSFADKLVVTKEKEISEKVAELDKIRSELRTLQSDNTIKSQELDKKMEEATAIKTEAEAKFNKYNELVSEIKRKQDQLGDLLPK